MCPSAAADARSFAAAQVAHACSLDYGCTMTAKERLRSLVDELSEEEAAAALVVVERRRAEPMLHALANAANDDEPGSSHEDLSARQALAAYERGEALSPSGLKRDLGIG
jgi:peptidyl-tRNA hydrolase